MNVFAVDFAPEISAQWLADQHVVKMTLESAQIASTALQERGVVHYSLYRPTHTRHPCTIAATKDDEYLWWVIDHGIALAAEYLQRFGKVHASLTRLELAAKLAPARLYHIPRPSAFPLAMPDEFKGDDPHESYLKYLRAKYARWVDEGSPPRWKRRVPNNPL
jgi:hypothetical protein